MSTLPALYLFSSQPIEAVFQMWIDPCLRYSQRLQQAALSQSMTGSGWRLHASRLTVNSIMSTVPWHTTCVQSFRVGVEVESIALCVRLFWQGLEVMAGNSRM